MCLTLYIDGAVGEHLRLGERLRLWCARQPGGCRLEIRDVRRWPAGLGPFPVLVTPSLAFDATRRLVVGDLTDLPAALAVLGCVPTAA